MSGNHAQRSRTAQITEFVGEGDFPLRLRIGELRDLQEKIGCGPSIIVTRLLSGEWLVDDVIETIRLALIGAGMGHREAYTLTHRNVKEGYIVDYVPVATNALIAAIHGVEDGFCRYGGATGGATDPAELMKFGSLYQFGGAAGFTPRQVDEMSLWEFSHAARGYMSANSSEEEKPRLC